MWQSKEAQIFALAQSNEQLSGKAVALAQSNEQLSSKAVALADYITRSSAVEIRIEGLNTNLESIDSAILLYDAVLRLSLEFLAAPENDAVETRREAVIAKIESFTGTLRLSKWDWLDQMETDYEAPEWNEAETHLEEYRQHFSLLRNDPDMPTLEFKRQLTFVNGKIVEALTSMKFAISHTIDHLAALLRRDLGPPPFSGK